MSVIKYSKLVRDRLPEIIESSGNSCTWEVLSDDQYIEMLDAKLCEMHTEYQKSHSMEALTDLLEVIRAVSFARGSSPEKIEKLRIEKAEKFGTFKKKILLKEVYEQPARVLIYQKTVDWLLFKDGFAIPLRVQGYFQGLPSLKTNPGESRAITLIIDGKRCSAELRNLPINLEKYPEHAPILQIRYRSSDPAAEAFRTAFARCWEEMCLEKQYTASKAHVRSEKKDYFCMYETEEPTVFLIRCIPSEMQK